MAYKFSMKDLATQAVQAITVANVDCLKSLCESNKIKLEEHGWAFLTDLNEALQDECLTPEQCAAYNALLECLMQHCKPKELIFAFLESCDAFKSSSLFHQIIPFITKIILTLPKKQQSLEIICDTLYSHVKAFPWGSDDYTIIEDEEQPGTVTVIKNVKTVELTAIVTTVISEFILPIAKALDHYRQLLTDFILKLLHYPLLYIHCDEDDLSCIACFQGIVDTLTVLYPTITNVIIEQSVSGKHSPFSTDQIIYNPIQLAVTQGSLEDSSSVVHGIGNLAYMIFCRKVCVKHLPHVLSNQYKLTLILPSLSGLFTRSSAAVVAAKALGLLQILFTDIPAGTLNQELLELPSCREMVAYVCWSMQFTELLTTRQWAAKLLPLTCSRFNHKARFSILFSILNTEKSPELLSYVYTLVKDFVHESWTNDGNREPSYHCLALMEKVFQTPEGDDGNVINDLNKISSALNLARYLVMRDKRRTAAYTTEMSKYIRSYITPVGHCLKLELKTLQSRLENIASGDYEPLDIELTVGDEKLGHDIDMEREAIKNAISRIELVLFVYNCLDETLNG